METLGIYVQVPFCASKCSFCNFSSRVERADVYEGYAQALEQEIERLPDFYDMQGLAPGRMSLLVDTLYVGGGTPPLLGAERLERVVTALRRRFEIFAGAEFTLEVTPGSTDFDFLRKARALGINRLSIGAQTFHDPELRAVGRLHRAAETCQLAHEAQRAGFANLSLDLIAGLPYQTKDSWLHTLETAASLQPQHLSLYLFEIDEKSRLGREVIHGRDRYHADAVPSEEFMADAYEVGREFLFREGYSQYEISNFAVPGYESRHNLKYWQLAPYLGLGAGAHSFDGDWRWANEIDPTLYRERLVRGCSPIAELRTLSPQEQLEEFFFLGLRQTRGVDMGFARRRWGPTLVDAQQERIETLGRQGLLETNGEQVRMTERAYLVSNEIFQEFVTV